MRIYKFRFAHTHTCISMSVWFLCFLQSSIFTLQIDGKRFNKTTRDLSHSIRYEDGTARTLNLMGTSRNRNRWNLLRTNAAWEDENDFQTAIKFIYYKNGESVIEQKLNKTNLQRNTKGCTIRDKYAFILHGWRESCDIEWVHKLVDRLTVYRGGCVVCIDYSPFAEASYMWLYRSFKIIHHIITARILNMIKEGLDVSKVYMFGFSFGGQLASAIGRSLSPIHLIKSIDTCDMAGPGFDLLSFVDHREAAEHVQCLHSSRDKGTRIYACHQNIRLGNCGFRQPASYSQAYYSNHGLCPQIYINAFDYPFYAIQKKPPLCVSRNPAINISPGFTIGYNEKPKTNVQGEIFVPTSLDYPYNYSERELFELGFERH